MARVVDREVWRSRSSEHYRFVDVYRDTNEPLGISGPVPSELIFRLGVIEGFPYEEGARLDGYEPINECLFTYAVGGSALLDHAARG